MDNSIIFELVVVVMIVLLQLYFFQRSKKKIDILSQYFPGKTNKSIYRLISNDDYQIIRNDQKFSKELGGLLSNINNYLKKNTGTADFSILENLVERSVEEKEQNVETNISLPLYIGLMGTFIGIIIGLFNIAFGNGVSDDNIKSFIGGVLIAMIASFFGLFLTVINNSKNFKEAKATCNEGKNMFYNFLQVELLPHLGTSLTDTLDRLKNNINDFNSKFEKNINLFDSKFTDNIQLLADSVDKMSENIDDVVENTKTQKEFLVELKKMGYNRMAEANIKVFQLLKDTGPTFIRFIKSQKDLTDSVENANQFVTIIENVLNRVKTFEENLNNLGERISTSEFLGSEVLKRIDVNLTHLDKEFELLKQHEHLATDHIENHFKDKFKEIQKLSEFIKQEIQDALNFNVGENPFLKLNHLEQIELKLSDLSTKLDLNDEFKSLKDQMEKTNDEVKNIRSALEETLKTDSIRKKTPLRDNSNKTNEQKETVRSIPERGMKGSSEDVDTPAGGSEKRKRNKEPSKKPKWYKKFWT